MDITINGNTIQSTLDDGEDGDIIKGAILMVKVQNLDGCTTMRVRDTGLDWLERRGMFDEALQWDRSIIEEER